ncbi:MAG TPA: hypothetical protein VKE74_34475 [Gemmataceae bacterium]|nr:hypothetical protein [Gemmataceae bacterium]
MTRTRIVLALVLLVPGTGRAAAQDAETIKAINALRDAGVDVGISPEGVATASGSPKLVEKELVHLKAFPKLQSLDLSFTPLTDAGMVHLKDLKTLRKLDLSNTVISDRGLGQIKGLIELRELNIGKTRATGPGVVGVIGGFPKLERLDLLNIPIRDAGLQHLEKLPSLKHVDLSGTMVTPKGIERLKKALPDATVLKLN